MWSSLPTLVLAGHRREMVGAAASVALDLEADLRSGEQAHARPDLLLPHPLQADGTRGERKDLVQAGGPRITGELCVG